MLKIILQSGKKIAPFNEPARDLRLLNKPLWLAQRDVLAKYTDRELELRPDQPRPKVSEPCLVYRDNLYFDDEYIREFLSKAREENRPAQAAFSATEPAFCEHILPLSTSFRPATDRDGKPVFLADLWYFPNGLDPDAKPLPIDLDTAAPLTISLASKEIGYYHVPLYMAPSQGDLVYQVPLRSLIAIDSWVHILINDTIFGLFGRGAHFEKRLDEDLRFKLGVLGCALYEGKQLLECSAVVKIGRNCVIDPTAIIHGPTSIGDNVTVGANAVIENCIIGDNVNISQGCQVMLSVVGDGTFLPFRASLFMTTIMENSLVAQNTCLQMSVIGRNTFVGAGSTWTDFNLLSSNIKARDGNGQLRDSHRPVLGGCIGHNCRIGAGMIIYPARTIESDVVLFASKERRVIERDVTYEESDHLKLPIAHLQHRSYPREDEKVIESW